MRLEFPASKGGSSVGRRKKIKAVKRSAHRAVQRSLFSPVFRGPLGNNDIFISGALPSSANEPIHIRVGTSAFGSPQHARLKSSASSRFSIGHATAVSSLSEESMLLGADGDYFDARRIDVPMIKQALHRSTTDQSLAVAVDSCMTSFSAQDDGEVAANIKSLHVEYKGMHHKGTVVCGEDRYPAARLQPEIKARSSPEVTPPSLWVYRSCTEPSKQEGSTINQVRSPSPNDRADIAVGSGDQREAEPDSESIWRRLMGVRTLEENAASTKAANSASGDSDTSDTALLSISHRLIDGQNFDGRTLWQGTSPGPCHERNAILHAQHQPMRAPFQVPLKLSKSTSPKNESHSRKDDAEALGREFIIGIPNTGDDNDLQNS